MPPNVLFDTLWHDFSDGWSIASRAYARAMRASGMGVQLHSWMGATEDPSPEVLAEVDGMLEKLERDLYLFSCTLSSAERSAYSIAALLRILRPRAFYTMFERKSIERHLAVSLNGCDGVMVPCSANRDELVRAGATNVTYVPYPYFPEDPHLALPPPTGSRVFYWIGRWEPRKAPHNLIRAFLRAFRAGEAELHLKLGPVPWRGPYATPEEVIAEELSDSRIAKAWPTLSGVHDGVHVHRGRWPAERVLALHASSHVYVSASRGEGLDLPAQAAKCAGRRVVTTDSGGPRDFLTETDILVPATGEIPAPPHYRWGPEATLADYDCDALVAAMQAARGDDRRPERISDDFHVQNVAPKIRAWVEGIVSSVPRERVERPLTGFGDWLNTENEG